MPERHDTKGRRIGGRASADKGKFPRRMETGLCPGFEEALSSVADELGRFAESVRAMAHNGLVGSEGVAEQVRHIERIARDALARFGPDPEPNDGEPS